MHDRDTSAASIRGEKQPVTLAIRSSYKADGRIARNI